MDLAPTVTVGNREIGAQTPVYIIAEIGVNFNGDLALAKHSIATAVTCGADAVKFQTFKAEEFVADRGLTYTYQDSTGRSITESQYDMFKRLELPDAWHFELNDYARSLGVDFLSSVADRSAVDLLCTVGAPALKLASEDLVNVALIEYVAAQKRPVLLSTGMGSLDEIEIAVETMRKFGNPPLIILHCISAYPTPADACNLRKIASLAAHFGVPVGFSDHSEGVEAAMIAIGLGACVVEKHFTTDRTLPGPDHKMSCDPKDFTRMVEGIRLAEKMLGSAALTYSVAEEKSRIEFRRSVVARAPIAAGTVITENLLAYRRPGHGLKPYERGLVIGRKTIRDIRMNEIITVADVES